MMKKVNQGIILSNEMIGREIFQMVIQGKDSVIDSEPGQFVNVYLNDKSKLLPRPISICNVSQDQLTLVYKIVGDGTKELSTYEKGFTISFSSPLGHGYDLNAIFQSICGEEDEAAAEKREPDCHKTICLVAGGVGVPPMVELAKNLRCRLNKRKDSIGLLAVLGFQNQSFLTKELGEYCDSVYVSTDDGAEGFKGNVLDCILKEGIHPDYILSCGPKPMLTALATYCEMESIPFQVSLEERMGCGYGACVGCTCKTKEVQDGETQIKQKKVCKDGPVFFGNEVAWNE